MTSFTSDKSISRSITESFLYAIKDIPPFQNGEWYSSFPFGSFLQMNPGRWINILKAKANGDHLSPLCIAYNQCQSHPVIFYVLMFYFFWKIQELEEAKYLLIFTENNFWSDNFQTACRQCGDAQSSDQWGRTERSAQTRRLVRRQIASTSRADWSSRLVACVWTTHFWRNI